ncbi:MAG: hypothetical protein KJO07_23540, partial [Deltaproteobacteria bacterium]|nr:hypothetical protein [Deltaproteobacteria bacterium]
KEGQLPAHEEVCPRPCGRNGCAPGHSRSKPTGTLAEWQEQFQFRALLGFEEVCVQMCDTTETAINGGPEGEFRGDCPDGSECKIANGLFFNIFAGPDIDPDPPTSIGICISTSQFPSCANHQLGDIGAYFVQPGQTRDPAGVGADNLYIPGCSPKATMLQKSEHCYDGEPDVPPGTFGDSPCAEPAAAPL